MATYRAGPLPAQSWLPAADSRVRRPPTGIVIHDTEGSLAGTFATYAQTKLLPHFTIGRDGIVHVHLEPRDGVTFHTRAADRWRPDWLVPNADNAPVSDVNRQCVGIELVSSPTDRAAGVPYTDEQYEALAELVRERLWAEYGQLPLVGHGQLQADRSDPVAFDWDRLTVLLGGEQPVVPDGEEGDTDVVAYLRTRIAALEEDQRRINAIKAELERFAAEAAYRRLVLRKARKAEINPADWLIAMAEAGL